MSVSKNEVISFVTLVRKEQDKRNVTKFVGKETGKSLVSDTEITRLAGIETGAQVNKIEGISITGGDATVTITTDTKVANINLSNFALKDDIASAFNVKGSKDTFAELPDTGNKNGDVWNIKIAGGTDKNGTPIKAGDNVVYIEDKVTPANSGWDDLGGTTDLSGYVEVETGKGLSTNDFTGAYKSALDTLIANSDETSLTMTKTEILRGWKIQKYSPRAEKVDFTIPVSSLTSSGEDYFADINIAGVTANDDAEIDFSPDSQFIAANAAISTEGDSASGKLRIYSKNIPTQTIKGTAKITKGVTT